jgi:hypothetical protein
MNTQWSIHRYPDGLFYPIHKVGGATPIPGTGFPTYEDAVLALAKLLG